LEHVPNVEAWVSAIFAALKPGGLFCAQNAFACGSGPDGSIPMHLAVNDRFEHDWDPLLTAVGFEQISSNWYRRPA
jgi:predicted methyltransferase